MISRNKLLMVTLFISLFTVFAGMSITAAFFSDVIDQKILIKTADISLGLPENSPNNTGKDMNMSADFNELDSMIEPLKKDDELRFTFKTVYNGSADAYVIPKLIVKIKNLKEGDRLAVYREKSDGRADLGNIIFKGNGQITEEFFLKAELFKPEEEKEYAFIIKLEEASDINGTPPVLIIPEMQLAVSQALGNDWAMDASSGANKVFEEIKKNAQGEESEIEGFSEVIGSDKTVDHNGDTVLGKKAYFIKIRPVINEAEGDTSNIVFYRGIDNKEKITNTDEDGSLPLCLNSANLNKGISYTVKNKAGTISSPVFVFEENAGKIICKKII